MLQCFGNCLLVAHLIKTTDLLIIMNHFFSSSVENFEAGTGRYGTGLAHNMEAEETVGAELCDLYF